MAEPPVSSGTNRLTQALRDNRELLESLSSDLCCPLCGSLYDLEGVRLLSVVNGRGTLSVQCFKCGTGSLVTAYTHIGTDLTAEELPYFAGLSALTVEDVLDAHEVMRHFHSIRHVRELFLCH